MKFNVSISPAVELKLLKDKLISAQETVQGAVDGMKAIKRRPDLFRRPEVSGFNRAIYQSMVASQALSIALEQLCLASEGYDI